MTCYEPEEAVADLNEDFAWIMSLDRVVQFNTSDGTRYLKPGQFKTTLDCFKVRYQSGEKTKYMGLGSFWLQHEDRRTYDTIGLWPPPRLSAAPVEAYNLWRGFAVEPAEGSWELMKEHVVKVIAGGNTEIAEYIFRWMAWTVQNPGVPAEVAVALRGAQGCGKGVLGRALASIFGSHALHLTQSHHLFGKFSAHLAGCVFCFSDEAYWPGNKSFEGRLKALLTEPRIHVEPKGVDPYEVNNCLHVFISSNEDWVVPAAIDDRRFFVADVSDTRVGDHEYFRALYAELENGGLEAMLHDLLELDLGDWHPREIVDTEARRLQKEQSLSPEHEWLLGLLDDGVLPFEFGGSRLPDGCSTSKALVKAAREAVPVLKNHGMKKLSPALRAVGAYPGQTSDGRSRCWFFLSLSEMRAAWDHEFFPHAWNEKTGWTRSG